MANEEHLAILKEGVDAWNNWRKETLAIVPDLSLVDLRDVKLIGANLFGVDLNSANLRGVNLNHANLSGAILISTDLIRADLSDADLSDADLSKAYLCDASLNDSNLRGADINGANLIRAGVINANLIDVNLTDADLRYANLFGVYFNLATLSGANFADAKIGYTTFGDVDLSEVKGLETLHHIAPSTIGIDTIIRSKGNIPPKFLLDAGVPQEYIDYLLPLAGKAIDFYSCFISHSGKDKEFVERLHADLQAKGVRCWYAPEDMKTGDHMRQTVFDQIRLHDKLLLVLSQSSIASTWVEDEVDKTIEEERRYQKQMLFPIRLDNTVMETDQAWAVKIRNQRHITDFTHWKLHDHYQRSLERLLRDLRSEGNALHKGG